jgi:hypothetical protein
VAAKTAVKTPPQHAQVEVDGLGFRRPLNRMTFLIVFCAAFGVQPNVRHARPSDMRRARRQDYLLLAGRSAKVRSFCVITVAPAPRREASPAGAGKPRSSRGLTSCARGT